MESADLLSQLQSIEQDSSCSKETNQKLIRTLEHKVTSLQSELNSTQSALADCQKEYDSYKVDVAGFVGVAIPATAGESTKCS